VQLVCSVGFAGVERYVVNLAGGLAAAGIDVTVIGGREEDMRDALAPSSVTWRPGASMAQAFAELRRLPLAEIVNSHMSQADLVVALARPGRRFRHVSTRHFGAPRGSSGVSAAVFGVIGRRIDAQLAISEFVAEHVDGRSEVVHSGVAERPRSRERGPFALLVQRLEPEKDTETAIRAWARCSAPSQGWRLRIAGDGSQRGYLERLATELGVADSVDFLGFRSDVEALLGEAGLVLAPTPREGLGISVLEAMAHGTPVIAAAGGGHLETVAVVAPELLFAPGDAAAAASRLDALVQDSGHRGRAGDALRELQRSRFTLESQVAGTRRIYERVLAQ